jgi:hypothetical protein
MSKHHSLKIEPEVASKAVPMTSSVRAPVQGDSSSPKGEGGDVETARLAYSYWEARGGMSGSPEEDWDRAERELKALRL